MKTLGEEGFVAAYNEEVAAIVAEGRLVQPIELPPEESAPKADARALSGPRVAARTTRSTGPGCARSTRRSRPASRR
jgi:hypothetical protein